MFAHRPLRLEAGGDLLRRSDGEINSLDLVEALELEGGPRSIPANLTIALKKSYRRLGLSKPWTTDTSGERT